MIEAIRELQAEGYTLTVDGDTIRYRLRDGIEPQKKKVARLLVELKAHKTEAVSYLRACHDNWQVESVETGPDLRTFAVFSQVLNREVFVSWDSANLDKVFLDGVPYSLEEIATLKDAILEAGD